MEQIRVDMTPKGIKPVCHSSQYDKGRIIRLNLVDGIQGYTLTGEETLELEVRKPDNNIVTAEVQNTSSNYVLIVTTEQMTACEGNSNCEIRIRLGDTDIGSINFILRVEEDPLKDGIESETEIHNLHTQIEEINAEIIPGMVADEVARQYTGDVIFDDEPTENHGDGYAVNSAGLKSYIPKAIDELDDVEINNPQANQAIVYNPTTQKFENGEVSTVNPTADDIEYQSGVTVADKLDSLASGKANKEIVTLSFTSSNDGIYTIPTSIIPLSKYPVFAWEEIEMQNYAFPITNYRHSYWMIWCRVAGSWAIEANKAFTVKVLVLS